MGGIDWHGLPYVVSHLGIHDPRALVERLLVIKLHKPQQQQQNNAAPSGAGME